MPTADVLKKVSDCKGADLETEYNACESAIERRLVKEADFHGKAAHLAHREEEPSAILCTMTLDNLDVSGSGSRYPVGTSPIIDPDTGEVPLDSKVEDHMPQGCHTARQLKNL
jgi:glycine cleavage system aminomethyltransferase T